MSFPIKSNFPYFFASLFWSDFKPFWKDTSLLHNRCFNKVKLITSYPNFPLLLMLATKASGKPGKSQRVRYQISNCPIHEITMLDLQIPSQSMWRKHWVWQSLGNVLPVVQRGQAAVHMPPPALTRPRLGSTQLLVHMLFTNAGGRAGAVQTAVLRRGLPLSQWKII